MAKYRDPAAKRRQIDAQYKRWGAKNQDEVNVLGARDHGAYAESFARETPVLGSMFQLGAIPAYNLAKKLGILTGEGSSEPGVDTMAEAYRGLGRGEAANVGDMLNWFTGSPAPIAKPPLTAPMSQGLSEEEVKAMVLRSQGIQK